jgi:hypothetical protein
MQETMTSFRDKPPQQMWIDQLLNGIQQWPNPNLMISSAPNNGLKGVEFQSLLTPNKCQELVLNFNSEAPSWWGRPFWPKRKNIIKWDKSSLETLSFIMMNWGEAATPETWIGYTEQSPMTFQHKIVRNPFVWEIKEWHSWQV